MTQDDVLFGYRLQLFDLRGTDTVAMRVGCSGAPLDLYRWKHQVDRQGLEMLRPRERRRPAMPNIVEPPGWPLKRCSRRRRTSASTPTR